MATKQSSASSSQGTGIRFSSPSLGGSVPEEQGIAHGGEVPVVIDEVALLRKDFKHFLELKIAEYLSNHSNMRQLHPGMSIEEALHRFRDEQKAKLRRKGPKLH